MATGISSPLALGGMYPSVDGRYVAANGKPFTSVSNAESALNGFPSKLSESCVGLTVLVKESGWAEAKEYWVQPKGTTPETYGLVEKGAGTTDYNDLDNKPTIGDGTNTALPIVGNVKVTASTASGDSAGVTVTQGQTAGEIEMNFTLPKGDKGEDGADGQDGAPGHNPCLGRFPAVPNPMPNGQIGDYLYVDITTVDPNTQEETTTTTVYHYGSNGWDGGAVIDADHPTLASGQRVTAVHIKDENGEDDPNAQGVLSAEAGHELGLMSADISSPVYQPAILNIGVVRPIDGSIDSTDITYGYVMDVELGAGETILLNEGQEIYLGNNVAVLFKTDGNGHWTETLKTKATEGNSSTAVISYTNSTNSLMYIGYCCYKKQCWSQIINHSKALSLSEYNTFKDRLKIVDISGIPYQEKSSAYVRFSDLTVQSGGPSWSIKCYDCHNLSRIRCKTGGDTLWATAAMAFYKSDLDITDIGEDFDTTHKVQALYGSHWYEIDVPADAKWVLISYNTTFGQGYEIELYRDISKEYTDKQISSVRQLINSTNEGYGINVFANNPFYYHFGQNQLFIRDNNYTGTDTRAIPMQSISDIIIAKRLGFKFIEANIKITSDNKFICIHGEGTKFGPEVKSATGNYTDAQVQDTVISSVSLDWIKTNVVYNITNSKYEKFRTSIPTLEEFCEACKINEIGVFAGTGNMDAIQICINYLGDNVIFYNPPDNIRTIFRGYVFQWFNWVPSGTAEQVADWVINNKQYGPPYMIGVGPKIVTALANGDKLQYFINEAHKKGYLVGYAYQTESAGRELRRMGMDFCGSDWEVNQFDSNNEIYDLNDSNFPTQNTNYTLNNGVITMADGDVITLGYDNQIYLGKGCLSIVFTGKLTIDFGSKGSTGRTIESNERKPIVITDYYFQKTTELTITSIGVTTIYELTYKTSKC